MTWITYALALTMYYALHSIMASLKMKSIFKTFGVSDQIYRILFNLIALVTAAVIIKMYQSTSTAIDRNGYLEGYVMIIAGSIVVAASIINYDLLAFIGLKKEESSEQLITSGLNRFVRHPLYLGVIIGLLGWCIVSPTGAALVTFIITTIYVFIGISLEERKLIAIYGRAYLDYQKTVPKLVPKLF